MKTAYSLACLLLALAFLPANALFAAEPPVHCDAGNGGITLPRGFCATVFADNLGTARNLTVNNNGDVYVALLSPEHGGGIVALRPGRDGHAAQTKYFGKLGGTGIGIHAGYLYFATPTEVLRYKLVPGQLLPETTPEVVVSGFPEQNEHAAKTFAFDGAGHLYVNVGAPSNACQRQDRRAGSPGIRPCPYLTEHGGIWEFSGDEINQHFPRDGERYATGIRNGMAIAWNPRVQRLYDVQMGRDQLYDNWPKLYTAMQSAELPAEQFFVVRKGENYGWPYCYYDELQHQKVLAPEYGGDGKKTGDCGKYGQPILAFPGHWAPEALTFYAGRAFPARYRGGAFIAFHGSWNRAPLPQAGYQVVFVPFKGELPASGYEIFAGGLAGVSPLMSPSDARFRANGVAVGPDGALYISDSQHGRIWRVTYRG
ncbi:MAG: PQQ-dependent sugar dehydrogenase [Gammaproteobacteria bacterium]